MFVGKRCLLDGERIWDGELSGYSTLAMFPFVWALHFSKQSVFFLWSINRRSQVLGPVLHKCIYPAGD